MKKSKKLIASLLALIMAVAVVIPQTAQEVNADEDPEYVDITVGSAF